MNSAITAQPVSRGNGILRFGCVAVLAVLQTACAGIGPRPPVPISEVIALSNAGTAPEEVIASMGRTIYAPRGSDFGKLADLGVEPPVLNFIQVRFVNDVELLTRAFALGDSRGGCAYCFPQPLDLANLATGGNGMSPYLPTGRRTGGGRPPGVPEWVPASPATAFRNAPALTIDEIASRAKAGVAADELVSQIRNSRLDGLIAQGFIATGQFSFGMRASVSLTGSRLAALHQQGVPAVVLDAIQEEYLTRFIEFQRQRFRTGVRP